MIDKQIHAKEFRLRILVTNDCNINCAYCLNDFQQIGVDFIDISTVKSIIDDYMAFCFFAGIDKPVVSFSGGEPGLHPCFPEMIEHAKIYPNLRIQVNTNGLIKEDPNIDIRYHIGYGMPNKIIPGQTVAFVVEESLSISEMIEFLKPFHEGGMKIKTFCNFKAPKKWRMEYYPVILQYLNKHFPVSGRYTGKQENRGYGCTGCKKDCVTLKALWVFPDNTCSPCPHEREEIGISSVNKAYNFHRLRG